MWLPRSRKESLLNFLLELVNIDVSLGDRNMIICGAHDLPFSDSIFDGVITQAILEDVVKDVVDPYRCVAETHRVLKPKCLIHEEMMFLQLDHMGGYDFTRFTHLGHRRLFRKFEEVESGTVSGTGMVLARSYQDLLLSFTQINALRSFIKTFTRFTSFFLQYFDYFLLKSRVRMMRHRDIILRGRQILSCLTENQFNYTKKIFNPRNILTQHLTLYL